jgi:hypothetical protein
VTNFINKAKQTNTLKLNIGNAIFQNKTHKKPTLYAKTTLEPRRLKIKNLKNSYVYLSRFILECCCYRSRRSPFKPSVLKEPLYSAAELWTVSGTRFYYVGLHMYNIVRCVSLSTVAMSLGDKYLKRWLYIWFRCESYLRRNRFETLQKADEIVGSTCIVVEIQR